MRIYSLMFFLFLAQSCSSTMTKEDCVNQCKKRGTEYAGIVPDGGNFNGARYDVCQCR